MLLKRLFQQRRSKHLCARWLWLFLFLFFEMTEALYTPATWETLTFLMLLLTRCYGPTQRSNHFNTWKIIIFHSAREPNKTALVCGIFGQSYSYRCHFYILLYCICPVMQPDAPRVSPAGFWIRFSKSKNSNFQQFQGGQANDVVAAVLSNSPEYPILFRWTFVKTFNFCLLSGVAGAGLALTPINHAFTGHEIAKQVATHQCLSTPFGQNPGGGSEQQVGGDGLLRQGKTRGSSQSNLQSSLRILRWWG